MKITYFGLEICGTMPKLGQNILAIAATWDMRYEIWGMTAKIRLTGIYSKTLVHQSVALISMLH